MHSLRFPLAVASMILFAACGESHDLDDGSTGLDAASRDAGSGRGDAGRRMDGATGLDASGVDATIDATTGVDAGPFDAGVRALCEAAIASAPACPSLICDGPPSWHWNGDRCYSLECGTCVGVDCALGYSTLGECEAAHATCDAQLCNDTGGTWMWWTEECGHRICGEVVPEFCLIGFPVCDCGPGETFVPGTGCASDPSCITPPVLTGVALCNATGGSWEPICCHTVCGEFCPDDCAADQCNCGPDRIFDDGGRGCYQAAECFDRDLGESCSPRTRCPDGQICCDDCGGPGCAGNPTCRIPVCDDDPTFDECGNNLLAP